MDPIGVLLLFIFMLVGVAGLARNWTPLWRARYSWSRETDASDGDPELLTAARQLGLAYEKDGNRLHGTIGPHPVEVSGGRSPAKKEFEVGGLLPGLRMRANGVVANLAPGAPLITGDKEFDKAVRVDAVSPSEAIAVLSHDARYEAQSVIRLYQATIHEGRLSISKDVVAVLPFLNTLLHAAHLLVKPPDVQAALRNNATSDPEVGVRLVNLQTLIGLEGDEARNATLRLALEDASPKIRAWAAHQLGIETPEEAGHLSVVASAPGGEVSVASEPGGVAIASEVAKKQKV